MSGKTTLLLAVLCSLAMAGETARPYDPPRTEREPVFEFSAQPKVVRTGEDRYEISFAVKGFCDATVGLCDDKGTIVRHLASGVLGANAPPPFQPGSLKQTLSWNGKDDLGEYVKEPEKLKVRVSLGLHAVFDKLLGPADPRSLPGMVIGLAVDEEGAYVFSRGEGSHNHVHLRKFDREARYLASLAPPPANFPESKLGGRACVEYEPGRRSHHGPLVMEDIGYDGNVIPGLGKKSVADIQPVVAGKRIFFCNGGPGHRAGLAPSLLFYLYTDGSSDLQGLAGRRLVPWQTEHLWPKFAASPDGRWLYMTGLHGGHAGLAPVVLRIPVEGGEAQPFLGRFTAEGGKFQSQPGSGDDGFNNPMGLDCDAQGRLYVADHYNNRIQVFDPEGRYLKTFPLDRPRLVCVHKKTGALYVQHAGRAKEGAGRGRSVALVTKLASFERPEEEFGVEVPETGLMALDSWSAKPRLWLGGGIKKSGSTIDALYHDNGPTILVLEERGRKLEPFADFDAAARKLDAEFGGLRWSGTVFDHVVCDPTREQVYFRCYRDQPYVFDLKSGKFLKRLRLPGAVNDIAFDKRGYLHAHFDPGAYQPAVGRFDPSQSQPYVNHIGQKVAGFEVFAEVPYDYGVELKAENKPGLRGALPVKDQPGAKYFQDGFGVTMQGEVAVQSNIYFVPRMEEAGWDLAAAGRLARDQSGELSGPSRYPAFLKSIEEAQKRGEEVYYIRRRPGVPLAGATIWTYDRTGELRAECAVLAGDTMAGVQIDEDGCLYFTTLRNKLVSGQPFLAGTGANLGAETPISKYNRNPFVGTYLKTRGKDVRFLLRKAAVPLEPLPQRPADLIACDAFGAPQRNSEAWVEGAEWLYAGPSPLSAAGCTCPSMRSHLDWYKRSFVPEAYRHAIGVLDTAGNLILRIGRYGNHDSAQGPRSRIPVEGDGIGLTQPRFISGTDTYLCFDDWGERLVVLKLSYHREAAVPIPGP